MKTIFKSETFNRLGIEWKQSNARAAKSAFAKGLSVAVCIPGVNPLDETVPFHLVRENVGGTSLASIYEKEIGYYKAQTKRTYKSDKIVYFVEQLPDTVLFDTFREENDYHNERIDRLNKYLSEHNRHYFREFYDSESTFTEIEKAEFRDICRTFGFRVTYSKQGRPTLGLYNLYTLERNLAYTLKKGQKIILSFYNGKECVPGKVIGVHESVYVVELNNDRTNIHSVFKKRPLNDTLNLYVREQ